MIYKHLITCRANRVLMTALLVFTTFFVFLLFGAVECSTDVVARETDTQPSELSNVVEYDLVECSALPVAAEDSVVEEPIVEDPPYSEEDLDLLSRLITAEMGASWVSDEIQLYVGSVVLNRLHSDLYPGETIYEVIYQDGQYSPTWTGAINNTPDERTIENAKKLLTDGSILPENVVFQANFKQGDGVYCEYYDEVLGTTTYFCYIEIS